MRKEIWGKGLGRDENVNASCQSSAYYLWRQFWQFRQLLINLPITAALWE